MKNTYILLIILAVSLMGHAQVNDVALSKQNTQPINQVEDFDAMNEEMVNLFQLEYNVDFNDVKFAKALEDIQLKQGPFSNSELLEITIPKGEYVDLYKLLPVENVWAVNYNGFLGFVPFMSVMQVSEKLTKADLSEFDVSPKLKSIDLVYPSEAEAQGISGQVLMMVHITENGDVDEAEIIEGVDDLNQAALKAIRGAKFKPAKLNKEKVDVWIYYPIDYTLMDD